MLARIARLQLLALVLITLLLTAACGPEVRINTYIESLAKAGSVNPKRDPSKEPMYAGHEALVDKLVAIGQPAVEPLLAALQNPENDLQFEYVAMALGKLAEPRAYTPIYNELIDRQRFSNWLFEALRAIDPADPRTEQAALLDARYASRYLLSDGIQSQEHWINRLVDPGYSNRKEILELLQQIGGLPAARVIAAYLSTTSEAELLQPALDALNSMLTDPTVLPAVDENLPRLIELLNHKDKSIRISSTDLLAASSEPAAVDALVARASSQDDQTDWDERLLVLRALVQADDPRAGEALWETVLGEQFIRTDTMMALVELMNQSGAYDQERLLTALDTGSGTPKSNAAIALAISDNPAVVPALRKISADQAEDNYIRQAAIQGLGRLGGNAAVPNLAGLLNDPDYFVAEEAVAQLSQIGSSEALAALIRVCRDSQAAGREYACRGLAGLPAGRLSELLGALTSPNLELIAQAYPFYIFRGEDGSEPVLIQSLKRYGDKAMALAFLNSSNTPLAVAAKAWAKDHGYSVIPMPGSGGASWGAGK